MDYIDGQIDRLLDRQTYKIHVHCTDRKTYSLADMHTDRQADRLAFPTYEYINYYMCSAGGKYLK